MFEDEYPYLTTILMIREEIIKIKPDPCSKCVVNLVCLKYEDPNQLCDDKIDYDNFLDWVDNPEGLFYDHYVSEDEIITLYVRPENDTFFEYIKDIKSQLSPTEDKLHKKRLLENFLIWVEK
jgi:hypothetical protein